MEEIEYLTKLGLSEKESSVYLTLLNQGVLSITEISKKTGIHRPALYDLLPKLQKKELIVKTKIGKRDCFGAESPKKIEKMFNKIQSGFDIFINRLSEQYENLSERPTVQYYYGKVGYDYLFDDIASSLPKDGIYYRYSARKKDEKHFNPTEYYLKMREKKRFERRVITSVEKSKDKRSRLEREIKVIPPSIDLFDDNVSSYIYKDKIAFVDYDTQTTFIISSGKIAKFQKKLFEILWGKL